MDRPVAPKRPDTRDRNGRTGAVSPLQIVLLLAYALIVVVLIVLPMYVDQLSKALEPLGDSMRFGIAVGAGLLITFIMIGTIAVKAMGQPEEPPVEVAERRPPAPTAPTYPVQPVQQPRPPVQVRPVETLMVTYPDLVEGGIFGDTFIKLSPGRTLKLRSLVVEPEHLN